MNEIPSHTGCCGREDQHYHATKLMEHIRGGLMSARRVWIAQCEVCDKTEEFDGSLSVEELGEAAKAKDWELPDYGRMFCGRCATAIQKLAGKLPF